MNAAISNIRDRQSSSGSQSWYESSARQRVSALLDSGSFTELCGPRERVTSPHLASLGLPIAFDDGVVVGEGTIQKKLVMIAMQEGGFMGGSVGEIHGAKITGLLERALVMQPAGVVIGFDSGGVRLHEANAGLVAMGEMQLAVLTLREAGIPVIGVIGGANGCYGGMSIIARCCDYIVMSEQGRLSISGPEVIETMQGVEEFDAQDRSLVWRTMGAKHRRLLGEVDAVVADDIAAFRSAVHDLLGASRPLTLEALEAQHDWLDQRIRRFGDCHDATDIWRLLGVSEPDQVPELDSDQFNALLETLDHCRGRSQ